MGLIGPRLFSSDFVLLAGEVAEVGFQPSTPGLRLEMTASLVAAAAVAICSVVSASRNMGSCRSSLALKSGMMAAFCGASTSDACNPYTHMCIWCVLLVM